MSYFVQKNQVQEMNSGNGHSSFPMLSEKQGCVNDCAGNSLGIEMSREKQCKI